MSDRISIVEQTSFSKKFKIPKAPRQLKMSREGKWVLLLTFGLGFAALNTGNNLLFLVWGFLLGLILISGILSELSLRYINLELGINNKDWVSEFWVSSKNTIPFTLANSSKLIVSYALEIEITVLKVAPQVNVKNSENRFVISKEFFFRVAKKEKRESKFEFSDLKRGKYIVQKLQLKTKFPFGFFVKSRDYNLPEVKDFIVFPEKKYSEKRKRQSLSRDGQKSSHRKGMGEEFYSLRSYREGDDLRHVHWKRSAQKGHLLIRENEAKQSENLFLALYIDPDSSVDDQEMTISIIANWVEEYYLNKNPIGLASHGFCVAPAIGYNHRQLLLSHLALLEPQKDVSLFKQQNKDTLVVIGSSKKAIPKGISGKSFKELLQ